MSLDEPITQWIQLLKEGDDDVMGQIWEQYFARLCGLVRQRIPGHARREFDEEDVVLSAIDCLYRGIQNGRYPRLNDRNNLWSLLVVIAARKVSHRMRDRSAQKRGGGVTMQFDEESFQTDFIQAIGGREPTPEFAMEVAEQAETLLNKLENPEVRKIAELKMTGHTNEEIANILGCGKRTVERRLLIIRRIWSEPN